VALLAVLAAAAALRESAPEVAELFARTRLKEPSEPIFGSSNLHGIEASSVLERALP
jgi:hypothetical protein